MENIDDMFAITLSIPSCPLWENPTKKSNKDHINHLLLKNKLGLTTEIPRKMTCPTVTPTPIGRYNVMSFKPGSCITSEALNPISMGHKKHQKTNNLDTDGNNGYLIWNGKGNNMPLPPELIPAISLVQGLLVQGHLVQIWVPLPLHLLLLGETC
jgi:hypothetical protein